MVEIRPRLSQCYTDRKFTPVASYSDSTSLLIASALTAVRDCQGLPSTDIALRDANTRVTRGFGLHFGRRDTWPICALDT